MRKFIFSLAATCLLASSESAQDNILLLIADDLGVDCLASYGEGSDLPITPNLDALAASGVLFRNTWANPVCSPTRATVQTGRFGFRTGIGSILGTTGWALLHDEITLPEMLDLGASGYSHATIGKWHLGNFNVGGLLAPNQAGYSHYEGTLVGVPPVRYSYYFWLKVTNGTQTVETDYLTTATVDDALAWVGQAVEPWFCHVSFNAPHTPIHAPPQGMYSEDLTGLTVEGNSRPFFKAMVEALDLEVGRLLTGLGDAAARTTVIFIGDNGTISQVTVPPFDSTHAKTTLYEGGVGVPLIVSGPSVVHPGRECAGLVQSTDIYATIADLAGVDLAQTQPTTTLDSVSIRTYLDTPGFRGSLRHWLYAETFSPNGLAPTSVSHGRAIRDLQYKILRYQSYDEFYDLVNDPFEQVDLIPLGLNAAEATAHHRLSSQLARIISS